MPTITDSPGSMHDARALAAKLQLALKPYTECAIQDINEYGMTLILLNDNTKSVIVKNIFKRLVGYIRTGILVEPQETLSLNGNVTSYLSLGSVKHILDLLDSLAHIYKFDAVIDTSVDVPRQTLHVNVLKSRPGECDIKFNNPTKIID